MESRDVVLVEMAKEANPPAIREAQDLLRTSREAGRQRLKELASSGSAMSAYFLASSDRPEALQTLVLDDVSEFWLKKASNLGCNLADYRLGLLYQQGKRNQEARDAFRKGVESGYTPAFRQLASFYEYGIDTKPDLNTARELLERGTRQGSLRAKSQLAWLLIKGHFGWCQRVKGLWLLASSLCAGAWVLRKHGIYSIRLV